MYTDAPNLIKDCFSWSNDMLQLRVEGMLIVLVTRRIWKMLQIRDSFLGERRAAVIFEGMFIVLAMRRILSKHCAFFSGNIIVPENNTLKAVVKFSRNIEHVHVKQLTLSPKTLTAIPVNRNFDGSHKILNWTADHGAVLT